MNKPALWPDELVTSEALRILHYSPETKPPDMVAAMRSCRKTASTV